MSSSLFAGIAAVILALVMIFTPVGPSETAAIPAVEAGRLQPDAPAAAYGGVAGTWLNPQNGYVATFDEDGNCTNDHDFSGTYTVEGNRLTVTDEFGNTQNLIFTINGDQMTLTDTRTGTVMTVTRLSPLH